MGTDTGGLATISASVPPYRSPLTVKAFTSATIERDDARLAEGLRSDRRTWADRTTVTRYETAFADWNGSAHAYAFMHGRVALSACLHALGLGEGDEVIVPGYTCVAVPNSLLFAGVTPVYADIELDTYGLDVSTLKARITPRTRAILLHHLFGLVSRDYDTILDLAASHGLRTIEDCAHSTGAEYRGAKVGTRADLAFYSTQRSKVFTTIEGGMAVTNDPSLAAGLAEYYERAAEPTGDTIDGLLRHVTADYQRFAHPGRRWVGPGAQRRLGISKAPSITADEMASRQPSDYAQRMPAPLAALGLNQLAKIDRLSETRRANVARWDDWCDTEGYRRPLVIDGSVPVFLRYPVLVDPDEKAHPERLMQRLHTPVGIWFATNIHPVPWEVEGCPNADRAVAECINLPSLHL